jgi:hypothetical protein
MMQRRGGAWLERHAHEWVEAGLISPDQADAIGEFEHLGEHAAPQRLPLIAEVASYLGSVLALMGGAVAVGQRWDDLTVVGRIGIGVAVALVGFVAGTSVMRVGEAGTTRLGSYLWTLGAGGVAMAAAVLVDEVDPNAGGWLPLIAGAAVLPIGLGLWRNLDRPLQFLTAAAGFGSMFGGLAELTDVAVWKGGTALMIAGAVLVVGAALGRLVPHLVVLAVGSSTAYVGAFMLGDYNEHLGPAMALATAAVVVLGAIREGLVPLLVLGVVGSLIATQALLATTFTGAMSSMIVALIGLAIVVIAVLQTRRAPSA